MFKGISSRIALQFTGFIFLLLLLNGALFLAADFGNARRISQDRLVRLSRLAMQPSEAALSGGGMPPLPSQLRERMRIITAEGEYVFSGALFDERVPYQKSPGYSVFSNDEDDQFGVLTVPVVVNGINRGFVQIVNPERAEWRTLPLRAGVYVLLSILVSCIIYVIALAFTRRSLKPAEEMMERLEQFTQDASHELRTPLAALSSSLDLALKTGEHEKGILSAKEDARELTGLIERLLELTRLDSISTQRQKIDLSSLVREVVDRYQSLSKKENISLSADITDNVTIQGDPSLVRQLLTNLLSNAFKFTDTKGKITVKLTQSMVSVSDTGIGISPKDIPHVFDRFFQADQSRANDGHGLGLSLVKRIVDLHGWRVELRSKPKKGTSVMIDFSVTGKEKTS